MLPRFLKNSQLRLLFSGSLFTVAFVWMAVSSYDVDQEEIRVFLIMSFILVAGLIISGFFFSLLIRLFSRDRGDLLGNLKQNPSDETEDSKADQR